ncbi:hypothetical protein Tco_0794690 [Tanacetum coccineum]
METKDTISSYSISKEQQMQQIQDTTKESCMVSFRRLHSYLKLLSNNDLKGTRTESGFKHAFATLFGQDVDTFASTMFLNVDNLEKQLDNDEFQEIGSMASFKVLETQVNDESQMRRIEGKVDSWTTTYWSNMNSIMKDEVDQKGSKKKTKKAGGNQDCGVMPSARSQRTVNGSKPKPRINNKKSRNCPASKSSCVMTKIVPIAEHSRNSRNFQTPNILFLCRIVRECVFNANHDSCVTKFLKEVNSHAKERYSTLAQTLDVSACTLNLSACTSFNPKKEGLRVCSELGIHDHSNEPSSSKLVPKVVPPANKTSTSQQELELLFSPMYNDASRFKSQEAPRIKTKTFANSDIKDLPLRYGVYQGRLLACFQDDAIYGDVDQVNKDRVGKDVQDKQGKDLKISNVKTKSKDHDKGLRSKITKHEGTSLQR